MLNDFLTKETILLQQSAESKEDAIRKVCEPLCRSNFITEEYVKSAIEALHTHGSYMVISPGVALIHARPSEAVKCDCMSLMTLKEPVIFGGTENDPVKILFAFATKNTDQHLSALREFAKTLADKEFMEYLARCADVKELIFRLTKY